MIKIVIAILSIILIVSCCYLGYALVLEPL